MVFRFRFYYYYIIIIFFFPSFFFPPPRYTTFLFYLFFLSFFFPSPPTCTFSPPFLLLLPHLYSFFSLGLDALALDVHNFLDHSSTALRDYKKERKRYCHWSFWITQEPCTYKSYCRWTLQLLSFTRGWVCIFRVWFYLKFRSLWRRSLFFLESILGKEIKFVKSFLRVHWSGWMWCCNFWFVLENELWEYGAL